jgi:hypothetical protein
MIRPREFLLALAAAGLLAASAGAEAPPLQELRTIVAGSASLSPEGVDGVRLSMGYNDAIAVFLDRESPFIQGFEIELKIPQAALALPGGFAYELWRRIDPAPDKSRFAYRGERLITQPLPARAGLVIQVPVRRDHALKPGPYATLVPVVVEAKEFPFLFKLLPLAKGVTPEIESALFQVRIRPILGEEGALSLRLRYPEGQPEKEAPAVTVDDKRVDPSAPLLLKAGSHRLRLSSETYRDENRSFTVEQGKVFELVIDLQDTTPVLVVEAPNSAIVTIDGVRLDHVARPQLMVEPGEHTAACRIGDYSITRKFTASRGKTYKLVLAIELQVQEGP